MKLYATNPINWLAILSGACIVVGLLLVCSSCSLRSAAGADVIPPVGGDSTDQLETTVARLAFIAGLASIGCVIAGILIKEYATALIGGPALAGLALVFLLLPAIAAAVKWLLIGSVTLALGGAAWLAYSRWKTGVALKLTAQHADRMEAAETDSDVMVAKNISHAEQVRSGVACIIEKARGQLGTVSAIDDTFRPSAKTHSLPIP